MLVKLDSRYDYRELQRPFYVQSLSICKLAVQQNGPALRYVQSGRVRWVLK